MYDHAVRPAARSTRPLRPGRFLGSLTGLFTLRRNDSGATVDVPEPVTLAARSPHLTAMDVVRPVEAFR